MTQQTHEIHALMGKTFVQIVKVFNVIHFIQADGSKVVMEHWQSCCEDVVIEDICGDLDDLVGTPILVAEKRTQDDPDQAYGEGMWTFYEIRTVKGSVTIRWYGSSNGFYSVGVNVYEVEAE